MIRGTVQTVYEMKCVGEKGTAKIGFGVEVPANWGKGRNFFTVTAWAELAEQVADNVKTDDEVLISYELRSWKTDDKKGIELVADSVVVLSDCTELQEYDPPIETSTPIDEEIPF
jgi:hypothetical protein